VFYEKAIEQGDTCAMVNLGVMLQDGVGVAKDDQRAAQLFKMAADENNAAGMCRYGLCLIKGIGVPKQKFMRGMRLLQEAAGLGNKKAEEELRVLDQ
jgi:TPR repeat protein